MIGTTTLFGWNEEHRRAELGFALGSAFWGRGYGLEAAQRALTFGFSQLDLHRVEADVDPGNEASLRILKKLGFNEEGYLRERYLLGGTPQDAVLLALLRSEWREVGTDA